MKKMIITALMILFTTTAYAHERHHHHHYRHCYHHTYRARTMAEGLGHGLGHMLHSMGRPSAWCGWYMRQVKGVADASYNLAANWVHYGHATTPHAGAIVVWPHHVGEIVGECGKGWLVHSGNDGHAVRTRCRSIAGAIAFRE